MDTNPTTQEFHLGLCLAGAISAGAYTEEVLDYFMEAWQDWEDRREAGEKVPTHLVKISTIGGASAGGMSGMIFALGLMNRFNPVQSKDQLWDQFTSTANLHFSARVDLVGHDTAKSPFRPPQRVSSLALEINQPVIGTSIVSFL